MTASHYAALIAARRPDSVADAFDDHVVACVLAVALAEVATGATTLTEATGLDAATLGALLAERFPGFDRAEIGDTAAPTVEVEEELLVDLLAGHLTEHRAGDGLGPVLVRLIARRALRPDHLWQDLGLSDRGELGRLLARHFPALHVANTGNMRWKKFFYRRLCEAEGFTLCTAPSCAVCTDFSDCFGEETGESRIARARRRLEAPPLEAIAAE